MHEVKVQVQFTADTKYGSYGDSLYFTEDEWAVLTEVKLESMKQQRIDKWVVYMDTVSSLKVITKQELQEQLGNVTEHILQLQSRQSELQSQIQGM